MFTRSIIISQQSFINVVNTSSSIFRKRIQKLSFPLHPGLITINHYNHYNHNTINMFYNMSSKINTTKIHQLNEGRLFIRIPHIDYEYVINCYDDSNISVKWDENDDLRELSLVINEDFNNLTPCLVNEVPYLK